MATVAESYSVKRGAAGAPISAHPAFPAIVALWFAALLGLGSMVLPIVLLERLVTVTGIATLVPSAEPPLGFTARAAIALTGAFVGAAIGLLLARQVARSQAPRPKTRSFVRDEERECRPISAHEELGEEGLGPPSAEAAGHKRRSLAIAEESGPSRYLQAVPLPGQAHQDEPDLSAFTPDPGEEVVEEGPQGERQEFVPQAEAADDALELADFTEDFKAMAEAEAPSGLEALRRRVPPAEAPLSMQDETMAEGQDFQPPAEFEDHGERQEFQPFAPYEDVEEEQAQRPSAPQQLFRPAPGGADPLPFAAPSRQRSPVAEADEPEIAEAEADLAKAAVPRLSVVEPDEFDMASERPADDRPPEELGLVQLAARLGASIEKRRALKARLPAAGPVAAPATPALDASDDFEVAEAEDAARAIADFFGPGEAPASDVTTPAEPEAEPARPAVPASMRTLPLDGEEDDEDAFAASFSLPLRSKPNGHGQPAAEAIEEDEELDDDEGEYSSLLAMKNPFTREEEFVRIDEPEDEDGAFEPAVTFPSTAPPTTSQPSAAAPLQPAPLDPARPFDPPGKPADSAARTPAAATPRDPGEADRELRAALATLQRMGGTA